VLRKATIYYILVRPHGNTRVPLYRLAQHFKLGILNKICRPNLSLF